MTAEIVADALARLAADQNATLRGVSLDLGLSADALGKYVRADGSLFVQGHQLANLPHYAERRDSIETSLRQRDHDEQADSLPVGRVTAADFLRTLRGHRTQVADAIGRMREDHSLSARAAAEAAGMPWQAFSLAVRASPDGPTIRGRERVERELDKVPSHLKDGLDAMLEHLEDLAQGAPLNTDGMIAVNINKGTNRLFIVKKEAAVSSSGRSRLERLFAQNQDQIRHPRSYESDRPRQVLRWMSTVLREMFPTAREVQAYYDAETGTIYVSSNMLDDNARIRESLLNGNGLQGLVEDREEDDADSRETRHANQLRDALSQPAGHFGDDMADEILEAIRQKRFHIPGTNFRSGARTVHLHAERRIKRALEADGRDPIDLDLLAGTRRACGFCAADLGLGSEHRRGPFWLSRGGKAFLDADGIIEENKANSVGTYVTRTRDGKLTVDYNTDSDSAAESAPEEDDDEKVGSNDVEMLDGAASPMDAWNGLADRNSERAGLILHLAAGRLTSVGIDDAERRVMEAYGELTSDEQERHARVVVDSLYYRVVTELSGAWSRSGSAWTDQEARQSGASLVSSAARESASGAGLPVARTAGRAGLHPEVPDSDSDMDISDIEP